MQAPSIAHHEADARAFSLPVAMWAYVMGQLSPAEVDELRDSGSLRRVPLHANGALWKYLYTQAFKMVSPNAQLSLGMRAAAYGVEGYAHEQAPADVLAMYARHDVAPGSTVGAWPTAAAPVGSAVGSDGGNSALPNSIWYDAFCRDWRSAVHVFVDTTSRELVRYERAAADEPLLDLAFNFHYHVQSGVKPAVGGGGGGGGGGADAGAKKVFAVDEHLEFGVSMRRKKSMSLGEYTVFSNLFEAGGGLAVKFIYAQSAAELRRAAAVSGAPPGAPVHATRIGAQFLLDASGTRVKGADVAAALAATNPLQRPALLVVDMSANADGSPRAHMENMAFVARQPERAAFSVGVFVTHERRVRGESTVRFTADTDLASPVVGTPSAAALHYVVSAAAPADGTDAAPAPVAPLAAVLNGADSSGAEHMSTVRDLLHANRSAIGH